MTDTAEYYDRQAQEIEAAAQGATDPALKRLLAEAATALRKVGGALRTGRQRQDPGKETDADIQGLAERMIASTRDTL